jgi:branched-subunit amino acid aminotransferase/4-amino-4-deoxychorismate lyase
VTRALVLEAGLAVERPVPMATFLGASEAFLTSTARAGQPIAVIDGRRLGPPGEATARVAAHLRAVLDGDPEP